MSQGFELASEERLQSTSDINWDLCFICQRYSENEKLICPSTKASNFVSTFLLRKKYYIIPIIFTQIVELNNVTNCLLIWILMPPAGEVGHTRVT